jgi:hypothetical protein
MPSPEYEKLVGRRIVITQASEVSIESRTPKALLAPVPSPSSDSAPGRRLTAIFGWPKSNLALAGVGTNIPHKKPRPHSLLKIEPTPTDGPRGSFYGRVREDPNKLFRRQIAFRYSRIADAPLHEKLPVS